LEKSSNIKFLKNPFSRSRVPGAFPWGKGGRCVWLRAFHHPVPLSRNLGNLTSCNRLGLPSPVTGLLYLFTFTCPLSVLLLSIAETVPRELLLYSRSPLTRTTVIWIGLALGRKYVENSTHVTYLEITGYRIKYEYSFLGFNNFKSGVVERSRRRYILQILTH
jgi:hypothetical protein